MATTTKTNAREQLLAFVLDQGWEPNPDKTVWSNYGHHGSSPDAVRVQDPHAFRKAAANGGTWELDLNYTRADSFHKIDNRLRSIVIRLRDAEGKYAQIGAQTHNNWIKLDAQGGSYYSSSLVYQLWTVTYGITGTTSLKQRAHLIAANPDLVLWLAEEGRVNYELRVAQERQRREAELKARKRPLDITVERSEWDTLTSKLYQAANQLRGAHGLTNLAAEIAQAEEAIAALRAALPADADAVH